MSDQNLPLDLFYRLRAFNSAIPEQEAQILEKNQLFFAHPSSLNDPFECKPRIQWDRDARFSDEELRGLVSRNMTSASRNERRIKKKQMAKTMNSGILRARYRRDMERNLLALYSSTSICCFTKKPLHIPAWSYYSDSHRGYCLGFDMAAKRWVVRGQPAPLIPFDILYSPSYPFVVADRPRDPTSDHWTTIETALLTKSEAWSAESESRIIMPGAPAGLYQFPAEMLKVVLLGARMSEEGRNKLVAMAEKRTPSPNVYQVRCAPDEYRLALERIA